MININSFRSVDFLENSYLIYDNNRRAALIDPGFYYDNEKLAIESYVRFLNLDVKMILLTHAHVDHVLGCAWLMIKYNVPVYVHEKDLVALKKMAAYAATLNYHIENVPDNIKIISHGAPINIGSLEWEVLHTPGHTPGSVSFFNAAEKTLFSGDILYHNDIGRIDLPGGNGRELSRTIKKIFDMDQDIKLLPGHGPETSIGYERKCNSKVRDFIVKVPPGHAV